MVDLTGRDWTEFYFDDAKDGFLTVLRQELPEFVETDPHDGLIQDAYMVGQLAHRDTGMIDLAAGEASWPTMQRRSSAIAMAALVGQRLLADRPAGVDILLDLVGTPGPADVILPEETLFTTLGDADAETVRYESQAGDVVTGNLEFTVVAEDGGVFSAPAIATIAAPWGAGAVALGDAMYYGHAVLTWDKIRIQATGSPDDYTTSLEYYDGRFRQRFADPGTVVVVGVAITMDVDDLLFDTGMTARESTGLTVRVTCVETGEYEDLPVAWGGGTNSITTATALGQAAPSTDSQSYLLAALWLPYPAAAFTATGVAYDRAVEADSLPDENESTTPTYGEPWRRWQTSVIAGLTRYWLRERVVNIGGATAAPTAITATPPDDIVWTLPVAAIQGESVQDVVGTSTGAAWQMFRLAATDYVEGSFEYLDVAGDTEWSLVDGLYSSAAEDKHFTLLEEPDGSLWIVTGDGTNGFVPPAGSLITAFYRRGAGGNGNIGALAIDSVEGGTGFLGDVRNPRPASGWLVREADDTAGLTRVKRLVPAAVRANGRMVTPEDIETIIGRSFFTADGRQPYSRVVPVEQGAGFKTVLLVCVPAGEVLYGSDSDMDELREYCNGVRVGLQRFGGLALSNQEVVPVHWSPVMITAVVDLWVVRRWAQFADGVARPAITAALSPTSVTESGEWRWWSGADITDGAIKAVIGAAGVEGLVDVSLVFTPALPITLTTAQLPLLNPAAGSLQININEVV